MKPVRFRAWAIVDESGDIMSAQDTDVRVGPLTAIEKPTKAAMREQGGKGIAPIEVTITAAKRAKRGRK